MKKRRTGSSTYVNYRNVFLKFAGFLEHDDAGRVSPEDVLRYKDHRLASVYPKSGKLISPKTVKDTDLAALKTVFGWAVTNRKVTSNPAAGITVKVRKGTRLRGKSQTSAEAAGLLAGALAYKPEGKESAFTSAAKRWVPWLCAYTGARVGEMAQLRKQDLRQEGSTWVVRITPEAGTVKTDEARDVVLHEHLVELGFPAFVEGAASGHLFLAPGGDIRMQITGIRNRLAQFARKFVEDRGVSPYHGLRHRFKEVGLEVGIEGRVLDAIQGQAPRTVAETYGAVTLKTQAAAMAKFPRVDLEGGEG